MLAFPLDRALTVEEAAILTPHLARLYAQFSERTLKRDLEILVEMKLLRSHDGEYRANTGELRLQMPRRLKRPSEATPAHVQADQERNVT